jgi:predicted GNAT family acetyltransferase
MRPDLGAECAEGIRRGLEDERIYLLERDAEPVSMTGWNARIPDCVQVGGVFTPPGLRSLGYARCAVAGSLLDVRERGVTRSVLFTQQDNHAARACYLGLGYAIVGDYSLLFFRDPQRVSP